jgi:hypothetical protein
VYDISVERNQQYVLENGVVCHNTGVYFGADTIWIVSRRQDKNTDKELLGFDFIINIEKSRFLKEKSQIPIKITFEDGMNRWSGLVEQALEGKYLISTKNGWVAPVDRETGEVIEDMNVKVKMAEKSSSLWKYIFDRTDFKVYLDNKYAIGNIKMISDTTEDE